MKLCVQVTNEGGGIPDEMKLAQIRNILASNKNEFTESKSSFACGDKADEDNELFRSLYICKKIVEISNGKIDFYSNGLDRGTTVSFNMQMEMEGQPAPPRPVSMERKMRKKKKKNKKEKAQDLSIIEENDSRLEESSRYPNNSTNRSLFGDESRVHPDENDHLHMESDLSIDADEIMLNLDFENDGCEDEEEDEGLPPIWRNSNFQGQLLVNQDVLSIKNNDDSDHEREKDTILQDFNSITCPETETSVLILENDAFTSLALATQCNLFGVKCSISTQFDGALEQVESRLKSSSPMFSLILIDWYSAMNLGADVLASTIYERVEQAGTGQRLPFICIMTATSKQHRIVQSQEENPIISKYVMKPIYQEKIQQILTEVGLLF